MGDCYNPQTGEHIRTDVPAPWMGRAGVLAPDYDPATHSAFWRGDHWEIVQAGPTPEEILARAKAARAAEVESLVVTTTTGKAFDGDEKSQDRMARAIAAMNDDDTTLWVLADNTPTTVTREELREALRLAGEAQTAIWVRPYQ